MLCGLRVVEQLGSIVSANYIYLNPLVTCIASYFVLGRTTHANHDGGRFCHRNGPVSGRSTERRTQTEEVLLTVLPFSRWNACPIDSRQPNTGRTTTDNTSPQPSHTAETPLRALPSLPQATQTADYTAI
ncbi:MAG: hypothetical protein ACLS29_05520 [Prevotellamassilia sp.]